jgi:diguanylate cyclase (GGDEF)-like protein
MDIPSAKISHRILSQAPMGITIIDDAGLILWCNQTLSRWAQARADNCVGYTEAALLQQDNPSGVLQYNGPHRLDSGRWVLRFPLPPVAGQQAICYLDVTEEESLRNERTQLAQQLEQHNTVESVSGLLNARAISLGLEPLVSRSRRYQNPLSVVTMVVINLDNISADEGQVAADKMVAAISHLLRDQMRWADLVGRLDSGQFVFVLPETDRQAAVALANKIARQLSELYVQVDDLHRHRPEACFGVTAWSKGDDSGLLLSRSADAALAASQQGAFSVETAQ